MGGRKWSENEDLICCEVCVEEYVIKKKKQILATVYKL